MSYVNGLPYITKSIDKRCLKHHTYGDLNNMEEAFFELT